jgi:DNA-binding response OmpR family regulator
MLPESVHQEGLAMKTVLIYGCDPRVLEVRRLLLRAQGYAVFAISDLSQMEGILVRVDLLIVCHSVPEADCTLAKDLAASRWPGIRDLILVALAAESDCIHGAERFFTIDGPARLVSVVRELVQSNATEAA